MIELSNEMDIGHDFAFGVGPFLSREKKACMRGILFLSMIAMLIPSTACFASDTVKIGVLARDGHAKALEMWQPTADYLTVSVASNTFEIVPLDFPEVFPAVRDKAVDFFIVNSSMFVTAKLRYGAEAAATMVVSRQGVPSMAFGGVILAMAHRNDINTMQDLKGKNFMAVTETSFGGWQAAMKELLDAGIDPEKDFSSFQFGGTHYNVVYAVQSGVFDAGTVRTDTLERLTEEGMIYLDDFKIIHPMKHKNFPFVCSTPLYPEWPLARVAGVSEELSRRVFDALKLLKPQDRALTNANLAAWVAPLDYTPVEQLQKTLGIGAYGKP